MTTRRFGLVVGLMLACLVGQSPAGEGPQTGRVTGTGAIALKRKPEILRVHIELLAKAKTTKDALAKLRDRKQFVKATLESMGAASEAIEFGEPSVAGAADGREQGLDMILRQINPFQAPGRAAGKAKEAPFVVVSCPLKVEIPLKASNPEDLVVLAHGLEERIKAADLGDLKNMKMAAPQDEEMQEQAQAMMQENQPGQLRRGEPIFIYIEKISEADRARAVREAFKRAQQHASQLAVASGTILGPVSDIQETSVAGYDPGDQGNPMAYAWLEYANRSTGLSRRGEFGEDQPALEATGMQPNKVYYRVSLTATFELLRRPAGR